MVRVVEVLSLLAVPVAVKAAAVPAFLLPSVLAAIVQALAGTTKEPLILAVVPLATNGGPAAVVVTTELLQAVAEPFVSVKVTPSYGK
jgi:hypothetical protein